MKITTRKVDLIEDTKEYGSMDPIIRSMLDKKVDFRTLSKALGGAENLLKISTPLYMEACFYISKAAQKEAYKVIDEIEKNIKKK